MAEYVETYRGCDIYRELSGVYTSPCTVYARFTVQRVRDDIDDLSAPPPPPPPEPGKVFVETYRGVDIYFEDAVHRYWFEYENVPYGPATLAEAREWIDTLLQPPPEPEEYWEYHSTYRGILIYIWLPSGAFYQATFGGEIHNTTSLSTLQAEIDAFLEPEPPIGEDTIKIVTTESDPYARYHGMSIDQSLDSSFWSTQPDKVFKTTSAGFTHTQTVTVAEGSHYVIYGNSASAGYMWHAKIFFNGTLVAEGDVDRGNPLRADFTVGEAPPTEIHTTLTINALESVASGEAFYISGILYETDTGIPIPNQTINHSYNGKSLGSSTTGVDGDYLKEVTIPESGVWTLRSDFLGTQTLQASRSQVKAIVTSTALEVAIVAIASAATGLAMLIYSLR